MDPDCSLDDVLSDDVVDAAHAITLPVPDIENLAEVENAVRSASIGIASRDALARFVIQNDYLLKLIPLVEIAEDKKRHLDLHKLCTIFKTLILLNDHSIIETAVTDPFIMPVLGALECKCQYLSVCLINTLLSNNR
jgi:protein phosphatase-4 regulatory subunit 3